MLLQKFIDNPKALIIAQPWAGMIVRGEKIWEMRKRATQHRGYFAVAEKGTGQLLGLANLYDCRGPHSIDYLLQQTQAHCGNREAILEPGFRYLYSWELTDALCFRQPVNYEVKSGAVSWVKLSSVAAECVADMVSRSGKSGGQNSGDSGNSALGAETLPGSSRQRALVRTVIKKRENDGAREKPQIAERVSAWSNSNTPVLEKYPDLQVPVAKDGTVFHPDFCSNNGRYQVGEKGNEVKFDNFLEALEYLKRMHTAYWRRPNPKGNWGGVKAVNWVPLKDQRVQQN